MGIIRKQSVESSIYIYIGFAIGAFNILFLFPKYLTQDQIGLTRLLIDVAMLIAMLSTFGTVPAIVKFYPFYKKYLPPKKNDLPSLSLLITFIGAILVCLLAYFFKDNIVRKFGTRSPLFVDYYYLLFPLTFFYSFWYLFEASCWSIQKTVLPNSLKEIGFRLITLSLALLFIYGIFNFHQFITLYSTIYTIPVIILFAYLNKEKFYNYHFTISSVTRRLSKQIITFSLFVFSGQALNVLARTTDSIVISSQSKNGLADTAIFTIATYLITIMDVPLRGMSGIAASVIAYAWKDRDMEKIKRIYQKTALTLVIFGLGVLSILILNANNMIAFFGTNYSELKYLLILLGVAKLIDLGTGLNAQILLSSKYWKIDFITSMGFVIVSIALNVILVKKYDLIGSAYATVISVFIYNLTRYIYIWVLFKIQPYTKANLYAFFIAAFSYFLIWLLPGANNIYIDAVIKTTSFSILYGSLIFYFRISGDINDWVKEKVLSKFI